MAEMRAEEQAYSLGWGGRMSGGRTTVADADSELITRFLAGDRTAFDSLFARYQDYVYNIALGIIGRPDDARDVAQDVFVQVFRSLKSFRRGSRFATWLYRIAVNRAVDAARAGRGKRWLTLDQSACAVPDTREGPEQAADRRDSQDSVRRVLAEVALQHRDVLVLRYYQELSVEEIAEVLGCTVTAAKVRLHRARHHFKEKYLAIHGQQEGIVEPLS